MNRSPRLRMAVALIAIIVLAVVPVTGQESLTLARDLYAAAAYEDALDVLNRLRARGVGENDRRAIEQYRAFCLLALGRRQEAERVIEAIIAAEPSYSPSATDVSPRLRAAFTDVRRRMLPAIIQQKYTQAKASFDRKEFSAAAVEFKQLLDMFADSEIAQVAKHPPLSDLRTLSAGFHELSVAAAAPPPAPPPPPVVEARPTAPVPGRIYGSTDGSVVPPIAIRQALPAYTRANFVSTRGVLEVIIDERGDVEAATMRQSVNRDYDTVALAAAKTWRYKPATLDGTPVKFRKLIQIALEPQR